jgi:hypothetical protein
MGAKRRRKFFRTCHLFTPIALLPVVRGVFGWSAGDRQDYGPPARVETKSRSASSPVLTEPALNPISVSRPALHIGHYDRRFINVPRARRDHTAAAVEVAGYACRGKIDGA